MKKVGEEILVGGIRHYRGILHCTRKEINEGFKLGWRATEIRS